MTQTNVKTAVVGNYIDNSSIEWTNEHDAQPEFSSEFSFGGLTISGNIFTANDVASFFNWIIIKPHGIDHFINGLNISGNVFKSLNGSIDRIEAIDTSIAPLDMTRTRRVQIQGNTFNSINFPVANPATETFTIASAQSVWSLDFSDLLPFGGHARRTVGVVAEGQIVDGSAAPHWNQPFATSGTGATNDEVQLNWSEAVSGKVTVAARIDNPN